MQVLSSAEVDNVSGGTYLEEQLAQSNYVSPFYDAAIEAMERQEYTTFDALVTKLVSKSNS